MPRQVWALTPADASFLIDHATMLRGRWESRLTVAVVQDGGITVGLLRMDGTKLGERSGC